MQRESIPALVMLLLVSACELGSQSLGGDEAGDDESESESTTGDEESSAASEASTSEEGETGDEPSLICAGEPPQGTGECGDGFVSGVEQCDDANAIAGDGCDACTSEVSGSELSSFVLADGEHIGLILGATPDQTTLVVALALPGEAGIAAFTGEGVELWATAPGALGQQSVPGPLRGLTDGSVQALGAYHPEDELDARRLWTARIDPLGQLDSFTMHPERSLSLGDPLLRADGSMVVVGGYLVEIYNSGAGVWAFDEQGTSSWSSSPWGPNQTPDWPQGATEQSDGTIVVDYRAALITDGDSNATRGVGLFALDPVDGSELWHELLECEGLPEFESIPLRVRNLAALSDDSLLVVGDREGIGELLRFTPTGELIDREAWPAPDAEIQVHDVIADDEGGAWIGAGLEADSEPTFVGYWHPDAKRRWLVEIPGESYRDLALEPGERLWVLTESGVHSLAL